MTVVELCPRLTDTPSVRFCREKANSESIPNVMDGTEYISKSSSDVTGIPNQRGPRIVMKSAYLLVYTVDWRVSQSSLLAVLFLMNRFPA